MEEKSERILIKRYANRKTYDTNHRRYVTLDDIEEMVRLGRSVQVVDHVSGEDITSRVYAQILFAREKRSRDVLPAHLLSRMIQAGEERLSWMREQILAPPEKALLVENEIQTRLEILRSHEMLTEEEEDRLRELLLVQSQRLRIMEEQVAQEEQHPPSREVFESLQQQLEILEQQIRDMD